MKILLKLSTTIVIDTADLMPEAIAAAIQDLDLYTDENADEFKATSSLSKEEWEDVIRAMLDDDISNVCSLDDEIAPNDFTITIEDDSTDEAEGASPPQEATS